jgi:membrane-associated phospholipid phosphatase
MHRDGIVGTWSPPGSAPAQLPLDEPKVLERWEPWVRGAVFDFELLSPLLFTQHDELIGSTTFKQFTLWSVTVTLPSGTVPPTATCERLMSMIRPTAAIFRTQLDLVEAYSDLRADRATEILAQLGPQYAFWSSVLNLHPSRTRWTLELIDTLLRFVTVVEMRFKHALACRRPHEYSPQIQPMILTPSHGALPSGHSTEAHAVALLLLKLLTVAATPPTDVTLLREQLMRQAARIAINRTVAGVHFPVDSAAGQLLGLTLAEYFAMRCTAAGGNVDAWRFNGEAFSGADDFDFRQLFDTTTGNRTSQTYANQLTAAAVNGSASLSWLWGKAVAEWS